MPLVFFARKAGGCTAGNVYMPPYNT